MAEITVFVDEDNREYAARVEEAFRREGVDMTRLAAALVAIALQAQSEEEYGLEMWANRKFEDAGERIARLVEYYRCTFREGPMTFNRAFHFLDRVGLMSKFPWRTTPI